MSYQSKEGQALMIDYVASKIGGNPEEYFPRVIMIEDQLKFLQEKLNSYVNNQQNPNSDKSLKLQIDISRSEIDNIKTQMTLLRNPLKDFEKLKDEIKSLQRDNLNLAQMNQEKVERMYQIERKLILFEENNQSMKLEETLKKYCPKEESISIKEQIGKIDEKILRLLSKDEFDQNIKSIQQQLNSELEQKIDMSDLKEKLSLFQSHMYEQFKSLETQIEQLSRKSTRLLKEISDCQCDIKSIKNELDQKMDREEGEQIWLNFDNYSTFSDFKELYQKCIPQIEKFENKIIENDSEMEKCKLIIRNFDESLCGKANKQNIQEIQDKLEEYTTLENLNSFKLENSSQIEGLNQKYVQLEDMINILGSQISKDIFQAVKRATQNMHKTHSSEIQEQTQVNDELNRLMHIKADKLEVSELLNNKINKNDLDKSNRQIDILHKQLKQLIVLINERMRIDIERKPQESDHSRQQTKSFLLQQGILIQKWIDKNDSVQILEKNQQNSQNNKIPHEILQFSKQVEQNIGQIDLSKLSLVNQQMNTSLRQKLKNSNSNTIGTNQLNKLLKASVNNQQNKESIVGSGGSGGGNLNLSFIKSQNINSGNQSQKNQGQPNLWKERYNNDGSQVGKIPVRQSKFYYFEIFRKIKYGQPKSIQFEGSELDEYEDYNRGYSPQFTNQSY